MVTNAKTEELDLTVDRCHALEADVIRLTAELEAARSELEDERNHGASLKRLVERAKARIRELEADAAGPADAPADEPAANHGSGGSDGGVDLMFGTGRDRSSQPEQVTSPIKAKGRKKRRSKKNVAENVYVFDDHDETRVAFDEFFAHSDPHLEKVRGFLLD